MNKEDVIRMAREAGFSERDAMGRPAFLGNSYDLERFAALVAAQEREECAKVCEAGIVQTNYLDASDWNESCENRAAAIRARGDK